MALFPQHELVDAWGCYHLGFGVLLFYYFRYSRWDIWDLDGEYYIRITGIYWIKLAIIPMALGLIFILLILVFVCFGYKFLGLMFSYGHVFADIFSFLSCCFS